MNANLCKYCQKLITDSPKRKYHSDCFLLHRKTYLEQWWKAKKKVSDTYFTLAQKVDEGTLKEEDVKDRKI
ncbi:MAG: hypothetical protein AABY22_21570 [Nanoarchaeota archaeon]